MYRFLLAIFMSSISLQLHAQCNSLTNYLATNITPNSVDVNLSGNGSGLWEFQYGLEGFTLGQGTIFQTTDLTTTISGLAASQKYRVFIRRICGSANSSWISFTFSTSCTKVLIAPVQFHFEGSHWAYPTTPTAIGLMDSCWLVSPQGVGTFWSVGPPHETRLNTGPENDHTTGYGQYLCLNAQGVSLDSASTLKMPAIDLTGLNNPQFSFWYHIYGVEVDSMLIFAKKSSLALWDTIHRFIGQQQFAQTENWQSLSLSLSTYANDTVDIQFIGYGNGTRVRMALDDISIHDSASCRPPGYFRSVSTSHNSVLLDWDPESAASFKIEYGKKGFTPGTGTKVAASVQPFRISNLTPDTTYVFYIRSECASSQFSGWTGPLEVNTDCTPILAPYFEDFEGAAWPQGGIMHCWDRFNKLDFKWNVGPPPLSWTQSGPGANNHTPGGSKFIVAHRPNQSGDARSTIITPPIKLDSVTNPELVFWSHMFGLQITAFEISIDSGDGFHLLQRIIGSQQLSKTAAWDERIFALPAYAGKTIKVKFTGIGSSNYASLSRIAVDDISIDEAPSCRKPTNLQLNHVSFTTAGISWLTGGSTNWMIKLATNGTPDSIFASSSNPLNLSTLQSGADYTIWVRDSCGLGDVGEWSAPLAFRTFCTPDTAPYLEDFDSSSFVVQTSYFSTGYLAPCWERSHEIGPIWQPSPATIFPNNLLPANDHTSGTGQYLGGSLFLANGTNEFTSFTSPHIDISKLPNPEMSFWYFLGGYIFSTNQLQLEINDGSGWQHITTIFGPTHPSTNDPWLEKIVDLSNLTGDTIRLRFKTLGDDLYATTAGGVDDISIYNRPCSSPSALKSISVGSHHASLSWISGGATNWVLRFGPDSTSFQYLTTSVNDSFVLNGLLPNTRYQIWVRDSCGADVSDWHGPLFIHTDCLPTQVPYHESFDDPSWVPAVTFADLGMINTCWRRSDSLHQVWVPKTGASFSSLSGPASPRNGSGNYLMLTILNNNPGSGDTAVEIISPPIINTGLQQPELNFWYHLYGAEIEKLKIYLEKTNGSRTLIDEFLGQQQNSQTDPWQQRTIPLSAFQGDTIKVIFSGKIGNTLALVNAAIDDLEIIDAVCSSPSNLTATNISYNSADLNWNSVSVYSKIEYGPAGFTKGTGTLISGVAPGYVLTGLLPLTTYEYYVQDSCRATISPWAGPFSFTTSCSLPVADFSYQGPALSVSFDGTNSLGSGLSFYWEYGDGNTGVGLKSSHTYAMAGTYNVSLVTTDTCSQHDTLSKRVLVCDLPIAVINYTRNGLQVSLDGTSSTNAAQYYWDLGVAGIFTGASPTASFPAKGNYPIYLVVTNDCGGQDTSAMNLLICDPPISSFTANISTVVSPGMLVYFDGTASRFADSFMWIFGDGNIDTSSLTPAHVYATSSLNYVVTLITHADCGLSDTLSYKLSSIGMDEPGKSALSLYPNPVKDVLRITSFTENLSASDFIWIDQSGKPLKVAITSISKKSLEIDVSQLPTGAYYILDISRNTEAIKVIVH